MEIIWQDDLHSMAIVQQPFANGNRKCETQPPKEFWHHGICKYVPREQLTEISQVF